MTSVALHMKHVCPELPEEILVSNVLPRLPMASLCRCRAVCKKWKALLTQSDLAARQALVSPVEEFVFISLKSKMPTNCLGVWNVLDVANNKVFPLSHDFLTTSAKGGCIPDKTRKILAADGGLLVMLYCNGQYYCNEQEHSLVVCNPMLKTAKVIPSPHEWVQKTENNGVILFTDKLTMDYKIVVFHPMEDHYQAEYMDVFESKIGMWRRVVNTVGTGEWRPRAVNSVGPPPGSWFRISRLVTFKSAWYRVYLSMDDMKPYLIKFERTTGVGSIINFHQPFLGNRDILNIPYPFYGVRDFNTRAPDVINTTH